MWLSATWREVRRMVGSDLTYIPLFIVYIVSQKNLDFSEKRLIFLQH